MKTRFDALEEKSVGEIARLLGHPDIEHLKRIAVSLHKIKCRLDHTDQCSWGYENGRDYAAVGRPAGTWYGWRHSDYLIKARDLVVKKSVSPKALADLLELTQEMIDE